MTAIKERYEDVVKQAISEFIEQALPDDPPVAPVVYDLVPDKPSLLDASRATAHATLYLCSDAVVDLDVCVIQSSWAFDGEQSDVGCVDHVSATKDEHGPDGGHERTLSWDEETLTWFCIDSPEDPLPDPTD